MQFSRVNFVDHDNKFWTKYAPLFVQIEVIQSSVPNIQYTLLLLLFCETSYEFLSGILSERSNSPIMY